MTDPQMPNQISSIRIGSFLDDDRETFYNKTLPTLIHSIPTCAYMWEDHQKEKSRKHECICRIAK